MYLDFHAHASISNVFMFGNNLPYHDQVDNVLFPFLMNINSPIFDIQNCNFSKASMERADPNETGRSKQGSGRVFMYKNFGIIRSYTIESNYALCKKISKQVFMESLPSKGLLEKCRSGKPTKAKLLPNLSELLREYDFESEETSVILKLEDFEEVGREVAHSLLDMIGLNPCTRLNNTPLKNLRVRTSNSLHCSNSSRI